MAPQYVVPPKIVCSRYTLQRICFCWTDLCMTDDMLHSFLAYELLAQACPCMLLACFGQLHARPRITAVPSAYNTTNLILIVHQIWLANQSSMNFGWGFCSRTSICSTKGWSDAIHSHVCDRIHVQADCCTSYVSPLGNHFFPRPCFRSCAQPP